MEENFSMEWKVFSMEWKWTKIFSMQYGKIVFLSIQCPVYSSGIKVNAISVAIFSQSNFGPFAVQNKNF